jgi:large subunit ribosomal protein L29
MKGPKFHEMKDAELEVEARDMESQIWKLRFQAATGQTEGLRKLRSLKRNIARVRTILREREIVAARAEGSQSNG